ncbi:DUF6031 family protein [Actinosynnema sp. NPDC020468]|uniref:DUF6031 family protein n=1 Tax=Actinosynnema sp. NPDC020468 TaxID=3154488 RepID=UPI00340D8D5A
MTGTTIASRVPVYPGVRAGHGTATPDAVRTWLQVAWLMLAECRAYVEDLEGGVAQPQMQQAAKLRMLEQVVDIDNRLAGRVPAADAHCLALGLEHGLSGLADATGEELADIFGLAEEFGGGSCRVDDIFTLWERLLAGFPGELPDRLVAQGQRDMLVTLRQWAELARSAGLDVGLLTQFMKDA